MTWTLALLVVCASPELGQAERAFEEGRFDDALASVNRALAQPLSAAERLRAYHLKAMTHAAFDDEPATVEAFRRALGLDPQYSPGQEAGPKVLSSFEAARRAGAILPPVPQVPPTPPAAASTEPVPEPFYRRPWFWGVVAGVAAAGAAAAVTAAAWPRPPAGNLGSAKLP